MNLVRIFPAAMVFPATFLSAILALQPTTSVRAQDKAESKPAKKEDLKFVRVSKDGKTPLALQTAVVKYKSDSKETEGVEVTLIGAVHIAEKSYYQDLNKLFTEYDALLYEMVSDPKQVPEPNQRGSSPVSSVQVGMKDMLELTFQLDEVDYKAKNFVHADMSPEEFFDSMNKRKEGVFKMFLRSVGSGLAMQGSGKSNDLDVLTAMLSEKRSSGLKRAMAEQFEMMDGQMAALQGDDGRSTLITERNAKAFKVLGEQIKAGKKKIGIFYGAGHLEDMHQRLLDDFRMQPIETKWMDAWDLKE
ncbi:MAG: hypothetical protein SFV81_01860 [Pirellulaceae bacterium]|nr:hypothetical protein [Pirellulaceae bacterium]